MSPGELLLDEAAGSQRLAGLDDEQVRDGGNVWVHASLSSLADFFSDHDSLELLIYPPFDYEKTETIQMALKAKAYLTEEVLVDSITLLLGHKHLGRFFSDTGLPVL